MLTVGMVMAFKSLLEGKLVTLANDGVWISIVAIVIQGLLLNRKLNTFYVRKKNNECQLSVCHSGYSSAEEITVLENIIGIKRDNKIVTLIINEMTYDIGFTSKRKTRKVENYISKLIYKI